MSRPRTWGRRRIDGALPLVQRPVRPPVEAAEPAEALQPVEPHAVLGAAWNPAATDVMRLRLDGEGDAAVEIVHDPAARTLSVARTGAGADAVHPDFAGIRLAPLVEPGTGALTVVLDGPLLEVFADDGATVLSHLVTLGAGPVTVSTSAATGVAPTVRIGTVGSDAAAAQEGHAAPAAA